MAASQGRAATRVAAGIFLTRILGFVRERVFAHYFGNGPAADAFRAALRIPNVIRNLLGEGTLSASFIPVYAGLLGRGEEDQAREVAGTIASLLVLATALATAVGIVLAPVITAAVAPGFSGDTRVLTIQLVEIMFPMSGLMILAAWCLGVLNTHGRFFLSYAAPSLWNITQIATLVALGGTLAGARLIVALAIGALAGAALQLVVQLPTALRLAGRVRWALRLRSPHVRRVLAAWGPVVVGAGVVQISSVIDTQLASFLGTGAVAVLGYAQLLALLPISLFGVSVAAAALPELSRDAAADRNAALARQIQVALRRILFFVVPAGYGYAALGPELVGGLFETGRFGADDTAVAAAVLAAYAIGLPAQSCVKLLASAFYATGDTRTPVRIAVLTMVLSAGLAGLAMQFLGPAGIALGAAVASYVNVSLLLRGLAGRLEQPLTDGVARTPAAVLAGALAATACGVLAAYVAAPAPLPVTAALALLAFGAGYAAVTLALGHPEARGLARRWLPPRRT